MRFSYLPAATEFPLQQSDRLRPTLDAGPIAPILDDRTDAINKVGRK